MVKVSLWRLDAEPIGGGTEVYPRAIEVGMIRTAVALILLLFAAEARSETVDVKYRGNVDLKTFECRDINRSSFIQRVCYDKAQSYMLISLKGTYYHYCELPPTTFDGLMGAPSMGQFYNQNIKRSGSDGPYDCRTHRVPAY
jgi:KTSC domain